MKKIQLVVLAMTMVSVLSGCGNYAKTYDKNTLIVKGNDSLVEVAVENFKDSPVKAEELTAYVEEQINTYNEENGKVIKQKSIDTEDMSKVKLVLTYKDIESYNGFNLLDCTLDKYSEIKASKLKTTYTSIEGKKVKFEDLEDVKKAKVLMISEATDIAFKGKILYYNKEVTVKDGIATTSGDKVAIIIYK